MANELMKYSEINNAIIKATKIDEIKEIRAKLEAMAKYRKGHYEDEFWILYYGIEAALKHIEIYDSLENKRPEGKPKLTPDLSQELIGWQDAGFFYENEPVRLRAVRRKFDDENLREYAEDKRLKNKLLYITELYKLTKELYIDEENENIVISEIDIRKGDFKEVLADVYNIDAIITDPPYPKEYLQCFSDLALYAKEHLKKDGWCIVYSGQYHLPEVIQRLSEHLTYVWTFCLYHVGKKQLVNGVNIMCGWKPILIFSNSRKKMRFSAYDVVVSEQREKNDHEWQQSESGVKGLIEIFSKPGQLIVDPFSGSGTFCKVAQEMGRRCIGAEID